ncbi:pentatricopeptide repeat-containing protein At1g71210-like [Chenopodium quinoa]|uniref:Pentatricopeptide repeat-containing protein n=1 Tax=Chenopodium quinoa TaxID=63459 RepID=A0A803LC40_CHEQI|nr:pentatricopeptide repeat-containing protein At1g71210-like [Chenopodium quinoa]
MLSPKLRYITRTRPFLSPLFLTNSFTSSSSAHPVSNPSIIRYQFADPSAESKEIASTFSDWFRTSKNPVFDRIFSILNRSDEDLISSRKMDLGIKDMGISLTESFVLQVLNYKKDDILSCLKFFDWAGRQPYFNHTQATCVSLFKILGRAKLTSMMVDLLDSFTKQRTMHRVRFNDMLVIGYALAGKIDVALQVFGKMRFHGLDLNEVAYHILLNSLVEEGCFDVMNVVLEQIRMRGHQNVVTHGIVMKSLFKQGQIEEAEKYFRELLNDDEVYLGRIFGVLVNALCKEKMFSHAGMLIQEFGEKGAFPLQEAYGVWIKNLAQAGKLDSAVDFFRTKKCEEGYIPEVFRYNVLICRLLKENRLKEVCDLLLDMKECQIVPDKVTMNAVLCFFCKAGMMDVVLELYEMRAEFGLTPHSLVYNYVINTLCGDGSTDEAYQMLKNSMKQGYFPGKRTFSVLADALCREGKLDKMKDLIVFALERKFIPSNAAYEKFIRALCLAKRVEDGYLIHAELNRLNKTPSESSYSYLICGFNKASRGDLTSRLILEMQDKGYAPSHKLFKAAIRCVCEMDNPEKHFLNFLEKQLSRFGCDQRIFSYFIYGAGHARRPELGRAVYEMMEKIGIVPNLNSDLFMLKCYLKSGRIADALSFFDDLSRKRWAGRKMYNTMVVGLCKSGKTDFATALLKQARNNGLIPSLQSYEELVKLCCSEKRYDDAIELINDLEKAGRKVSSFLGNILLLHAMRSGDLYKAWLRSRDVSNETPSSAMLGQLIDVFSGHVSLDSKAEDLEEVIQKCFPLDLFSYNMMLRKLSINKIDEACQLFKRLCFKGYQPNRWTYDIIVHGLYKHGRVAEAELWADQMLRQGYVPTECTHLFI